MKKRICKHVIICVESQSHTMCQTFTDVNFNSMYDVVGKVRLVESVFILQYKQQITGFSVQIREE